tara:strand:+ start:484 stop:612 length:129 start_codon:yes stop_codon:yes gene_type:complete
LKYARHLKKGQIGKILPLFSSIMQVQLMGQSARNKQIKAIEN